MSMRADWVAAKARAKTHNNGQPVTFPKDLKLGSLLDKMEANEKLYKKAGEKELNRAWARAAETYFASVVAAQNAAAGYEEALKKLTTVNDVAKRDLDSHLTMRILAHTTTRLLDRDRLAAKIAKFR